MKIKISKNKFLLFFMFLQLVIASGNIRQFGTDPAQFANFFLCLGVSLIYNRLYISPRIVAIIGIFGFIALPAIILQGADVRLYFGWIMKMGAAFFLVSIYKQEFWEYLLSIVQVLALISLPFYAVQLIAPRVLQVFQPITDALLIRINGFHQYAIVWRYNQWYDAASTRNSGFMWEPSAFAAVLIWALLARLIKDKFSFNKWTYVILIAAFTTFSTGGFIGLSCLLLASMISIKANKMRYLGIVLVILGILAWDLRTGVVSENYNTSVGKIEQEQTHIYNATTGKAAAEEVSRVAAYVLGFRSILASPFGYGYPRNMDEYGLLGYSPNAFMNLFIRWGIFGIAFVIISMLMTVRFLLFHYYVKTSSLVYFLLFMALMMSFHSTTLDSQIVSISVYLFYWLCMPRIPRKEADTALSPKY